MPRLRMRTIGVGVVAEHGHQPLVDLRLEEDIQRASLSPPPAVAAAGRTGAARVICGMCDSGADSICVKTASDAAFRPDENHTNSPPIRSPARRRP